MPNPWHFLFRSGGADPLAPPLPLTSTLAIALLVSLAVNGWKLVHLRYTPGEAAVLFAVGFPAVSLLVLTARVNPLQYAPVYTLLFALFAAGFLSASPPRGVSGWFGAIVALGLVWAVVPLLHALTGPVVVGVALAFLLVQVALPLDYRSAALDRMKEPNRFFAGRDFLKSLADNRRLFLGREKFRWFLAEPVGDRLSRASALHASVWRQLRSLRVRLVEWDDLPVVESDPPGERMRVRYRGVVAGTLGSEKDRPAGAAPAPRTRYPALPNVALLVGPVDVTVARGADGLWRVVELPDTVPISLAPASGGH